ncbi:trypsin-like peptidase domain-containing protein [Kitasatospora sp. NPDC059327]|uniref:trypsin-like peptidase domain-containing protein n=1 Tax=Kitasatospora sp. NPDC059327 TaxID=3346803 RepID=UPI0036B50878
MDERRLADIRCDGTGRRKAGSGYLVAPRLVLTARHVVVDDAHELWPRIVVRVGHPRAGAVERRVGTVCWTDPGGRDAALLRLDMPVDVPGVVRWGRAVGTAALPYTGLGYPLQTRTEEGRRLVEHLHGVLSPLSGGEGVHDLYVLDQGAAPRLRDDNRQAWGGVSGSAVFCQGQLVGIVVHDDEEHENRRLHALPVRTFATSPEFVEVLEWYGVRAPVLAAVGVRPAVPSSGYRLEVREFAAAERFEGRVDELAEMAAFCREPPKLPDDAGAYWRWLADPWSGKTTLLAQFMLDPPPGVHVLAFFISQRHGGNSDRAAFLATFQRQLREYLEDREFECATQGQFIDGLRRAVERAEEDGCRLALLVDGLDEDTGVISAVSGHSIAALLPRQVPSGLRIVVAGRPNPPVPGDVHPGHPLRDRAIDHWLAPSPAAQVVREEAERSLDALLTGGGLGRELVALIAAAGGGLSAGDLAELTEESTRNVELILGGAAGRVFQRRVPQWPTASHDAVLFSFAHQELLTSACDLLAPATLHAARERIHAFVACFSEAGWPLKTPEYALRSYSQMLRTQRDAARMADLVVDTRRHERLWRRSGGHQAALDEITAAFNLLLTPDDEAGVNGAMGPDGPDPALALRLAMCRDTLLDESTEVPERLLEVWVRVGAVDRALALVGSQRAPGSRARGLAEIAQTLLLLGYGQAVRPVLVEAETAAREAGDNGGRRGLLEFLAQLFALIGDNDHAVALVGAVATAERRLVALVRVIRVLAWSGCYGEAIALADTIPVPDNDTDVLGVSSMVLTLAGKHRETEAAASVVNIPATRALALSFVAGGLAGEGRQPEALEVLAGIAVPEDQVVVLVAMIRCSVEAGLSQQAVGFARRLADVVRSSRKRGWRDDLLAKVSHLVALTGEYTPAADLASGIHDREYRTVVMLDIACLRGEASELRETVEVVRRLPDVRSKASGLITLAVRLAEAGEDQESVAQLLDEAAEMSHLVDDREMRVLMLAEIAAGAARTGQEERAAAFATDAVLWVRESTDRLKPSEISSALGDLIEAHQYEQAVAMAAAVPTVEDRDRMTTELVPLLARAGHEQRSADLALAITDPEWRDDALADITSVFAESGRFEEAQALVRIIAAPEAKACAQRAIALALAEVGELERAAEQALAIIDHEERDEVLIQVAAVLAESGGFQQATDLAYAAAAASRRPSNPDRRNRELTVLTVAMAEARLSDLAVRTARTIPDFLEQLPEAGQVLRALVRDGHDTQALALVRDAAASDPHDVAEALASIAKWMAEEGRHIEAAAVARQTAKLACGLNDPKTRDDMLASIAEVLAEANQDREAIELAFSIVSADEQEHALLNVIYSLERRSRHRQAANLARTVPDPLSKTSILAYLARTAAQSGRLSEADELGAEALASADSLPSSAKRDDFFKELARAFAHTSRHREAADLARRISDEDDRLSALAETAAILAQHDHHEEALNLAEQITDQVEGITEKYARHSALAALARVSARIGRYRQAFDLATAISDEPRQRSTLVEIVSFPIAAGRHREAVDLATSCDHPETAAEALSAVSRFLSDAGRYQEAMDAAASIPGGQTKSKALRRVARAMSRAGLNHEAIVLARTIAEPEHRAKALAAVAAADGLSKRERGLLLTEALATTAWEELIKAVGRVAPSALSRAALSVLEED